MYRGFPLAFSLLFMMFSGCIGRPPEDESSTQSNQAARTQQRKTALDHLKRKIVSIPAPQPDADLTRAEVSEFFRTKLKRWLDGRYTALKAIQPEFIELVKTAETD